MSGRLIEIAHDKPWPGRMRIRIRPNHPSGSLITITGELDRAGLDWVMRRRGWAVAQPRDDSVHRIGLVTSKTGPGAVFSIASEYMAELAVEEINADGGLAGHPVELVVGDDATDAEQASLEARRLGRSRLPNGDRRRHQRQLRRSGFGAREHGLPRDPLPAERRGRWIRAHVEVGRAPARPGPRGVTFGHDELRRPPVVLDRQQLSLGPRRARRWTPGAGGGRRPSRRE
ncbi:hypothetical protein EIL87_10315 [Saccharopolyspora rhizosphaerae]|uniref:Leucine-binding protein domain-containing protein n=1 Tax=Saccharopolyspora rhizosphaerae TaxID=2492662 RepID=A0A426JWU9_9PSEU|nr:hypothetical protein EIL87_10315 [Saccharopolyspora rhizosphaerae]